MNEMIEKNKRIYYDSVPDVKYLPKIDKIIKVNPTQISDDLNKINVGSALDTLVPREVRGMVENYKKDMMKYISEHLDKYENEGKITSFLNDLSLPFSLESAISNNDISDYLWKRISEIQQKGGALYLTNQISNIERKSEEISKRISELEIFLYVYILLTYLYRMRKMNIINTQIYTGIDGIDNLQKTLTNNTIR